jgi:predicted dehydrogenase
MGKLRVGVVGCGIGRAHIEGWKQNAGQAEVAVICDVDETKAKEVAAKFELPLALTSLDELCRRDDIDVVDLCTPPFLHLEQIKTVLRSGKHVICEKPLVASLADVDALAPVEKESGRRLMPIFQYRFGHGLQKLRHLLSLAGEPFLATAETSWRRRAPYYAIPWRGKWKTELGGCILSHAIHTHDIISYVLGPPKKVFARASTRVNPIETEDCASASLEMANGALVSLSATLGSSEEITRHRFCFRNFTAESNTSPYNNSQDPWKFTGDSPEIQREIDNMLARFVPEHEGYAGQFSRFCSALEKGEELPVTLADARTSLELVTAIYVSAEQGGDVALPITPGHSHYTSWLPGNKR